MLKPKTFLRGCSHGSGLARLGGISLLLRNTYKNKNVFIWQPSQPGLPRSRLFLPRSRLRRDENFPYERASLARWAKILTYACAVECIFKTDMAESSDGSSAGGSSVPKEVQTKTKRKKNYHMNARWKLPHFHMNSPLIDCKYLIYKRLTFL